MQAEGLTLADLIGLDDLTLGDLPQALTALQGVVLSDLGEALHSVRLGDLIGALLDPATGAPFADAEAQSALRDAVDALGQTLGDLASLDDVTIGDLVEGGTTLTLDDIRPVLGFITVQALLDYLAATGGAAAGDLGDLLPDELGHLTLADLFDESITEFDALLLGELLAGIEAELDGFTLGDLLLVLLDPSTLAFGGFDFETVDVASLPESTVAPVSFTADFTATGLRSGYPVEVEVELPGTASYVPGSGEVTITPSGGSPTTAPLEPEIGDTVLTWTLTSVAPGDAYEIAFDVRPSVTLGATPLAATGRILGTDQTVRSTASVQVAEGLENNDFPPPNVTQVEEDTIYLTYISSASDIDVFEVVLQDNDRLAVELSNLDVDLDLALYVDPADDTVGSALSGASDAPPIFPITDPDQTGADAEPLDDFVRLDEIDPNLQLIEVSNTSGTDNEVIVTDLLPAGTYYLQVFGPNGNASPTPAALQVQVEEAENRPECVAVGALPAATPGTAPSLTGDFNTLILINEMRLEQFHSAGDRAAVTTELAELVTYLEANPQLGVDPLVVPVDGFAAIRDAYDAWDDPANVDDACDPEVANAVVEAINTTVIDPVRDQLDYVVFIGSDEQIPMARLTDATTVANEYDYRHEFDGDLAGANSDGANAFTSVFWERRYLSDEPYGESAAQSLGNRFLYVSDIALGRLVESPTEIVGALDDFVTYQGSLDTSTASVLGYDFLADGSAEIAADLVAAGLPTADELADGIDDSDGLPWDRADAEAALVAAGTNALVSLNAHFDHYRALPAAGDKVPGFTDNLIAAEVETLLAPNGLAQTVIFSMGCHGGLATPDTQIAATNEDWAAGVLGLGGVFIGNTGFGYGDTEAVAYTEALMARFTEQATNPIEIDGVQTTIGQALTYAKNQYIAELARISVYDEKALMESTFFGLPFYRTALPNAVAPPVPVNVPQPDAGGDPAVTFTFDPENNENVTPIGTYYSNVDDEGDELTIVAPGRPIQPSESADVSVLDAADPTVLDQVARGVIVLDMTSTYVSVPNPVVATPIFDESGEQPEPALGNVTFPASPVTLRRYVTPGGERQSVVVATGQYRSSVLAQRLDEDIDVAVYYSAPGATDTAPPKISTVTTTLDDGLLTVTLNATDTSGVDRVYVLIAENPGLGTVDWIGLDLTQGAGTSWSGSIQLDPATTDVELFVQAKDTANNVAYATNKANNFADDGAPPPPPPPTPDLETTVDTTNLDPGGSGWYVGPVTVLVDSGTLDAEFSVDGAPFQPVVGGEFVISEDGIRNWTVRLVENSQQESGQVRIDSGGAPTISFGTPAADGTGVYPTGSGNIDVVCSDTSLVDCELVLSDGTTSVPVENNDPLPTVQGSYTLTATATDALGNVTAPAPVPFEIGPGAVILPGGIGVVEGDDGSSVVVEVPVTLSNPSNETITVDWTTTDTGATTQIALEDVDFVAASGTLTFEPGETTKTIPITVLGDDIDEPPLLWGEWGLVALSNPSPNASIDPSFFGVAIFVIIDDDDPPVIRPFTKIGIEGDSGTRQFDVPVTLSNPSAETVTVDWTTVDNSLPGEATADVDYVAASGTVTFAPGETEAVIPIQVVGDTFEEDGFGFFAAEYGLVPISNPSANASLHPNLLYRTGLFVIIDDDDD